MSNAQPKGSGVFRLGNPEGPNTMARGRKPGFKMSDEHRVKIQNSNVLNALIEHAEGKRDMSSTQVTAGLGLLDRVLPKLATTTIEGTGTDGAIMQEIVLRGVAAQDEG